MTYLSTGSNAPLTNDITETENTQNPLQKATEYALHQLNSCVSTSASSALQIMRSIPGVNFLERVSSNTFHAIQGILTIHRSSTFYDSLQIDEND